MGFHCGQRHWISKTVSGSKYEGGPCRTAFHFQRKRNLFPSANKYLYCSAVSPSAVEVLHKRYISLLRGDVTRLHDMPIGSWHSRMVENSQASNIVAVRRRAVEEREPVGCKLNGFPSHLGKLKKGRGEKRSAVNGILRAEQVVLLRAW